MDILFFREEGMSEKGHSTYKNCNYIVMAKEIGKPYKLLPYSIWYCNDNRQYVAVKVKDNPTINTVIDSNDYELESLGFDTLREAKLYTEKRARIAGGIDWKEGAN